MNFPNDWAVFLEDYSFRDHKEFYTNGARLIPTFRVEQMLHHYLRKATENAYKNGYEKGYADGKELLNAAIAGQETLQKHISQRWIPVTERLPKVGGSYLVFSSKSKTVFTARYWKGDRWANRANGQFITHWMPLPQPPEGE